MSEHATRAATHASGTATRPARGRRLQEQRESARAAARGWRSQLEISYRSFPGGEEAVDARSTQHTSTERRHLAGNRNACGASSVAVLTQEEYPPRGETETEAAKALYKARLEKLYGKTVSYALVLRKDPLERFLVPTGKSIALQPLRPLNTATDGMSAHSVESDLNIKV